MIPLLRIIAEESKPIKVEVKTRLLRVMLPVFSTLNVKLTTSPSSTIPFVFVSVKFVKVFTSNCLFIWEKAFVPNRIRIKTKKYLTILSRPVIVRFL